MFPPDFRSKMGGVRAMSPPSGKKSKSRVLNIKICNRNMHIVVQNDVHIISRRQAIADKISCINHQTPCPGVPQSMNGKKIMLLTVSLRSKSMGDTNRGVDFSYIFIDI